MKAILVSLLILLSCLAGGLHTDSAAASGAAAEKQDATSKALKQVAAELARFHADDTVTETDLPRLLEQVHLDDKQIQSLERASRDQDRTLTERCAALQAESRVLILIGARGTR